MNQDHLIQGSEAWKSHRRNCVTATDIGKILNINPWCTALKLWNQKLGLEPEQQENQAMRLGSELEPIALQMFIEKSGIKMTPKVIFHEFDKWKMASLDGVSECGKYAVEIKCSQKIYERAKQGIIDDIYKSQMNWQMYTLDIRKMYFAAYWQEEYFDFRHIIIIEVERDDDFLNEIMPKIHEFYNCMMEFTPPIATDKDFIRRTDVDWFDACDNYSHAKHMREKYEEEENEYRKVLIRLADNQSCQGAGIRVSKGLRKGNVDYGRIEMLKTVNLDDYRKKPTEFYRISENG